MRRSRRQRTRACTAQSRSDLAQAEQGKSRTRLCACARQRAEVIPRRGSLAGEVGAHRTLASGCTCPREPRGIRILDASAALNTTTTGQKPGDYRFVAEETQRRRGALKESDPGLVGRGETRVRGAGSTRVSARDLEKIRAGPGRWRAPWQGRAAPARGGIAAARTSRRWETTPGSQR